MVVLIHLCAITTISQPSTHSHTHTHLCAITSSVHPLSPSLTHQCTVIIIQSHPTNPLFIYLCAITSSVHPLSPVATLSAC